MEQNIQLVFDWYLAAFFIAFSVVAVIEAWRNRVQHWDVSEEKLCRCPDCQLAFVVARTQWFAKCPRCRKNCRVPEKFRHGA